MKIYIVCILSIICISQIAFSQSVNTSIWFNATYNSIGGDFNGKGTYEVDGFTAVIPEFKPAVGWEIGLGLSKGNHRLNVALGYTKFNEVTFEDNGNLGWIDEIKDGYLGYYEANYLYRFVDIKRLDLFGVVGLGMNTKFADNAAEASFSTANTKYKAPNLNVGINAECYVTKRFFINMAVLYKFSNHGMVEFMNEEHSIFGINGNWLSVNLGLGFKFGELSEH